MLWRQIPSEPNANCPVCGARVYFFRNKQGGCAYFDSIGVPWPKHPCIPVFQCDEDAVRQAKLAFESAQNMAGSPTPAMRLDGEGRATWRAQRATGKSDLHARLATATPAPGWSSPEQHFTITKKERVIGWWTVMAMFFALICSLPLSFADLNRVDDSPAWFDHLVVTLPTIVSLVAIVWFLWRVPSPRPSLLRLAGTLVLAPVFLVVGVLSFLFTLGIGSFVFAWILYRQAQVATSRGTAAA